MDTFEGQPPDPRSLHKYIFAKNDPADRIDPSGNESLAEVAITVSLVSTLALNSLTFLTFLNNTAASGGHIDGWYFSARVNGQAIGGTLGGGVDFVYQTSTHTTWVAVTGEFGTSPVSIFLPQRNFSANVAFGPIFGMSDPNQMSGAAVQAVLPLSVLHLLPGALFSSNKAWGAMTQLAKRARNIRLSDAIAAVGVSTSGPSFFQVGFRNNSFSALVSYTSSYQRLSQVVSSLRDLVQPIVDKAQNVLFDESDALSNNADQFLTTVQGVNR